MNILTKLKGQKIDGPIFVKDFDADNNPNLIKLNQLLELVGDDQKPIIEDQIKLMTIGATGEKNVYYELLHSYLPLLCLHDIRLEYRNLTSQYDFIIIFKNYIMVLETKRIIGDIMIDSEGNFTRVFKDFKGNVYKKEGMYSPISQNQKHIDLLERMLLDHKLINNIPIYSLVVIANPKTIITKRYAPEEIKKCIIKYDQLKNEFTRLIDENKHFELSDDEMFNISDFIMENNRPIEYDYVKMLNLKIDEKVLVTKEKEKLSDIVDDNKEEALNDELYEKLRTYRAEVAKKRNFSELYFVFNNKVIEQIVLEQPTTKEQLLSISGFGKKKWQEYGADIIAIVKEFQGMNKDEPVVSNIPEDLASNPLVKELRKYRYHKATEENTKPYFIFTNNEMESLIESLPRSKEELLKVRGFGPAKVEKYGDDLLSIIKRYSK